MLTFLVERRVPEGFRHEEPETVALHARWAVDAYKKVGAFWMGGVITDNGMFSLVSAEQEEDLQRYGRSLNFAPGDMVLRRVIRPIGPFAAQPRG